MDIAPFFSPIEQLSSKMTGNSGLSAPGSNPKTSASPVSVDVSVEIILQNYYTDIWDWGVSFLPSRHWVELKLQLHSKKNRRHFERFAC